jgi:hypothetical protein
MGSQKLHHPTPLTACEASGKVLLSTAIQQGNIPLLAALAAYCLCTVLGNPAENLHSLTPAPGVRQLLLTFMPICIKKPVKGFFIGKLSCAGNRRDC